MTIGTRRYVIAALCLTLTAISADVMLLHAFGTRADGVAGGWASALSGEDRLVAANQIEQYPAAYQQALMHVMTPSELSAMWRSRASDYLVAHPELSNEQRAVILEAKELVRPDTFTSEGSSKARIAERQRVGTKLSQLLGADSSLLLLKQGAFGHGGKMSALPMRVRLEEAVVQGFRVLADTACNCDTSASPACLNSSQICSELQGCTPKPYTCGLWNACNGLCVTNPILD